MDDLVADLASRYMTWPTQNEGCPQAALHGGEVSSAPRTVGTLPRIGGLATVVAGQHYQGIFFDPRRFQGIEHLSGPKVDLGQHVGP
ncbi:hypothetical protein D9M71_779810 [compost metagenome]